MAALVLVPHRRRYRRATEVLRQQERKTRTWKIRLVRSQPRSNWSIASHSTTISSDDHDKVEGQKHTIVNISRKKYIPSRLHLPTVRAFREGESSVKACACAVFQQSIHLKRRKKRRADFGVSQLLSHVCRATYKQRIDVSPG